MVLNIKEFDLGCFAVSSVYHAPLVALYKQLSSRPTWHSDQKLWSFRNEAYEELMNRLMAADFAGWSSGNSADPSHDWLHCNQL